MVATTIATLSLATLVETTPLLVTLAITGAVTSLVISKPLGRKNFLIASSCYRPVRKQLVVVADVRSNCSRSISDDCR
ncbi:hypothetical protein Ae201684_000393 [Aphanomyces euteiches]|uniref:Uncharacterized protein n=1 Tax=Aphanomyces euteiches TaxID=100861 RepID=A0A6G0XXT3_9STRA|nr:hypothetical protein Ae201684_000393 [Aphanomyces euteiches]